MGIAGSIFEIHPDIRCRKGSAHRLKLLVIAVNVYSIKNKTTHFKKQSLDKKYYPFEITLETKLRLKKSRNQYMIFKAKVFMYLK